MKTGSCAPETCRTHYTCNYETYTKKPLMRSSLNWRINWSLRRTHSCVGFTLKRNSKFKQAHCHQITDYHRLRDRNKMPMLTHVLRMSIKWSSITIFSFTSCTKSLEFVQHLSAVLYQQSICLMWTSWRSNCSHLKLSSKGVRLSSVYAIMVWLCLAYDQFALRVSPW